jgi:G3E family GTPase
MTSKIESIVLLGFLGSGKTTLMNQLLSRQEYARRRCAVLVNDFGKLPVDAGIISGRGIAVAEINGGSIFCACVKGSLINAMEEIAETIKPDVLLIEATGLARPKEVTALLQTDSLREKYDAPRALAVIDAVNYPKLSQMLPALNAQVKVVDTLLINKCDLVNELQIDELEQKLRLLNRGALILRAEYCAVSEDVKIFEDFEFSCDCAGGACGLELCSERPADTDNFDYEGDCIIDRLGFEYLVERFKKNILRGKGLLDFGQGLEVVSVVNGNLEIKPHNAENFRRKGRCAASFILLGMTPEEFEKKLRLLEKNA